MKFIKWVPVFMSFALFFLAGLNTFFANRHLLDQYDAGDYLRYLIFFPGITLCVYLASAIRAARTWPHFFVAVFLAAPALIAIHFVVSVMNAHAGNAYWGWQLLEIGMTYLAWAKTGKHWSNSEAPSRKQASFQGD
ncbi:hypothetical protein NG831_21580 [Xanthomonas sacchari]|uniref:hypothetical protein n=1 Tax=Xanthomonas sacchari TaxID=56458 RepID=UPI002255BCF1|nr:hypothetical protein [Xanthomonas sacchari]MCW0377540.1 hypothetical protein [Xanthomonas sacchari]MCW0410627.1 hypothetical protein [Xanthomonas sacchari]MCW0451642.1 hypothetical protein [Xanthomonas sacchari]UYK66646.1 hypothetical protein NG831_21580 [Xanthomonas sacchari]UYK76819.1 hypothetical protein NG825_20915 [Xanthomonas sacchari]